MAIISITAALAFGALLCLYELPQLLKSKNRRELWSFSVLLALGISLAVLRSLKVSITNPSDWLAWLFSPVSDLVKNILK